MKVMITTLLLISVFSASAEATYYRFWRGKKLPAMSSGQFLSDLNEKLLPATGELMTSPAQLRSYHPVTPNQNLTARFDLPDEFALLEYESKEAYQAYRSTAEGKAYGDLHWLMFDKNNSKSLEPAPYQGTVALEQAYDLYGRGADWEQGVAYIRIYQRQLGISDEEFLEKVRHYFDYLHRSQATAVVALISQNQVLEYSLWSLEADEMVPKTSSSILPGIKVMASQLEKKNQLRFGEGIQWPRPAK